MRNKKLILIILPLFLGTLWGCGQKGPLYKGEPPIKNDKTINEETR